MSVCDEKLRKALLEVWEKENERLEEEMKQYEPHVFSHVGMIEEKSFWGSLIFGESNLKKNK